MPRKFRLTHRKKRKTTCDITFTKTERKRLSNTQWKIRRLEQEIGKQHEYTGDAIKWPVIKRSGWFLSIPRLRLSKECKFRYYPSKREKHQKLQQNIEALRSMKQKVLDRHDMKVKLRRIGARKEDINNPKWIKFLETVKDKQDQMSIAAMTNNLKRKISDANAVHNDKKRLKRI